MARITTFVLATILLASTSPGVAVAWDGLEIPDLRGTWILERTRFDTMKALPDLKIEVTAYDDDTGAFAGESVKDGSVTSKLTGLRANEQATFRIDDTDGTPWNMRGVITLKPLPVITGGYTLDRENLADGDIDGSFEMRMKAPFEAADGEPAAAAAVTTPEGVDVSAAPCDLSRIEAAKAALETATPYAYTLAMNTYQGRADELFFDLLVADRVQDPTTWDRVTTIPHESGWTVFETRRLGEEVWQRIDHGAWTAEPPDEDVLGMPWPLDIIDRQLLPGGQAEEPAFISGWAGRECIVSLLFRTEDGGKGEGRTARLVFFGDEILPRSIEFERTLAPTGASKKDRGASRPGDVYSMIATIQPGDVEPVMPPEELDAAG